MTKKLEAEGSRKEDNGDKHIYVREVEVEKPGLKQKVTHWSIGGSVGTLLTYFALNLLGINPVTGEVQNSQVTTNTGSLKELDKRIQIVEKNSDNIKYQIDNMVTLENLRHQNENREFDQYKEYIKAQVDDIKRHLNNLDNKLP